MIREMFKEYETDDGFLKDRNKILDGNAILYTGCKLVAYEVLGIIQREDYDNYLKIMTNWEAAKGLLNRAHKPKDDQSHDDYIGACVEPRMAKRVYNYGSAHHWYFNNTGRSFTLNDWHGRTPGFVCHVKVCAGVEPSFWDRFFWTIDIVSTSFKRRKATSGRIQDWVKVFKMQDSPHWLTRWASNRFIRSIQKKYKGEIGEVFAIYHDANHPLSRSLNTVLF